MANLDEKNYHNARLNLQATLIRVRIMLWAKDYESASLELIAVSGRHREIIQQALMVKTNLTRILNKGLHDNSSRNEALIKVKVHSTKDDELFLMAPLANSLVKIDESVSIQLAKGTTITDSVKSRRRKATHYDITPHESGFKYSENLLEEGHWEIRAYNLEEHNGILEAIQHLETKTGITVAYFDFNNSTRCSFPCKIRAFHSNYFSEFLFYDAHRFIGQIIAPNKEYQKEAIDIFLNALA